MTGALLTLASSLAGAAVVSARPAAVSVDGAVDAFRAEAGPSPTTAVVEPVGPPVARHDVARPTTDPPPEERARLDHPNRPSANEATTPIAPRTGGEASASGSGTSVPPASLPAEGVYVYRTSGFEELNYPGTRRSYPDTTTITVLGAGCGVEYRWTANSDHRDSSFVCAADDSLELQRFTNRNSFHGHASETSYDCAAGSTYGYPRTGEPGKRWTYVCATPDGRTTLSVAAEIVEFTPVHVAGSPIDTMHVRHTTTLSGAQTGSSKADLWYAIDDARLVKNVAAVAVTAAGPFGPVEYRTNYEVLLVEPGPRS